MMQSQNRQSISPTYGSVIGRHPTWNSYDGSRYHWRKTFYINGKISGKRVKKKRKKFTRKTIKDYAIRGKSIKKFRMKTDNDW